MWRDPHLGGKGPVAQLDRALASEAKGSAFESQRDRFSTPPHTPASRLGCVRDGREGAGYIWVYHRSMKKAFIGIVACVLIVLLGVGIWVYVSFVHVKPLSESELTGLTPDWSVVTKGNWSPWHTEVDGSQVWNPTASFNTWLATIPREDKAWPVVIDILIGHPELFERELIESEPGSDPDSDHWNQMVQLLEQPETPAIVDRLSEALSRPYFGFGRYSSTDEDEHAAMLAHGIEDENWDPNPEPNPGLFDLRNHTLGKLRDAAHLLKVSAMNELKDNQPDVFVDRAQTIIGMRRFSNEFPSLISWFMESAFENVGYELIAWALENHSDQFTDEHLSTLQSIVGNLSSRTFVWENAALEFHDLSRRLAQEDGSFSAVNFRLLNAVSGVPTNIPDSELHPSLQRILWVFNTSVRQGTPLSKFDRSDGLASSTEIYELHKGSLSKMGQMFTDMHTPHLDSLARRNRLHIQKSLALQLTLAVHRHKLRHGSFPDSIDNLDNDLLPVEPIDLFTWKPLGYRLTDTGPIIYSVGDDRIDNQGTPRWYFKNVSEYGSDEILVRKYRQAKLISPEEAQEMLKDNPEFITGDWVFFPFPKDDPEPAYEELDD